jgi:hypothetical protein
MQTFVAT